MSTIGNWRGPNIVKNGLLLYLDAGSPNSYYDKTSITWKDISGIGNDGTLISGSTYNSLNGGNIFLDGIDDAVSLNPSYFGGLSAGTIDIWVRASSTQSTLIPAIFSVTDINYPSSEQYVYLIYGRGSSGLPIDCGFTFISKNLTSTIIFGVQTGSNTFYFDNLWHNVIYQSDINGNKIYIDGVQKSVYYQSGDANTQRFLDLSTPNRCNIGRRELTSLPNANLTGNIGSIKIYDRVLSSVEISQNYNVLKGRFGL